MGVGEAVEVGVVVGVAVGAAVGVGVAVGIGVAVGVGTTVGVAVAVGAGVGLGVGAGATSSSPARVAWMRYPAVPVPELSRCPNGPLIVATIPDARVSPSAADGPTTARTVPEPSSRVTPRPSVSWSSAPMIVPVTRTRWPSDGSPTDPIASATAVGRSETGPPTRADSEMRNVRWEKRLETEPSTVTVVPAGHEPVTGASR